MIQPRSTEVELRGIWLIVITALVCQTLAFAQAIRMDDAYWIARGGALVAASAAFLVIVQVRRDVRLEYLQDRLAERRPDMLAEIASKVGIVEASREVKKIEDEVKKGLYSHRRSTLMLAACIAGFGELVHGFGYLLGTFFGIGGD